VRLSNAPRPESTNDLFASSNILSFARSFSLQIHWVCGPAVQLPPFCGDTHTFSPSALQHIPAPLVERNTC
jgi:hypothetical protein